MKSCLNSEVQVKCKKQKQTEIQEYPLCNEFVAQGRENRNSQVLSGFLGRAVEMTQAVIACEELMCFGNKWMIRSLWDTKNHCGSSSTKDL